MILTAPQIYALANNSSQREATTGLDCCHWCGSPCEKKWPHDDPGLTPFYLTPVNEDSAITAHRIRTTAKFPGNKFICLGCRIYRFKRTTINFMNGEFKDGKEACGHSWWADLSEAKALTKECNEQIYPKLLEPPHQFVLSLTDQYGGYNYIHLAIANNHTEIKADTVIHYTLNNKPMEYTVYELEQALKHGTEYKSPGVRVLVDFFGPYDKLKENQEQAEVKRNRGRPGKTEKIDARPLHRTVTGRSG